MKISIVTPNYNYGRFLNECLESVLAQITPNSDLCVEHIVQDGCSTDNSVEILNRWSEKIATLPPDTKARYSFQYISEKDGGQTDAINRGLSKSSGDLVCWLNTDETYLPGALEKIVTAAKKHPESDLFFGEFYFTYNNGRKPCFKRGHTFVPFILKWYGCFIPSCATFWRHKILDDGLYLDPSYKVIMDGEYWTRLCVSGYKFHHISVPIATFLWHDSNVSSVFTEKRLAEHQKIENLYAATGTFLSKTRENSLIRKFLRFIAHQLHRLLLIFRIIFGV